MPRRRSSFLGALLPVVVWLLLLVLAAPWCVVSAVPELQQVHVISRHGARTPLPKDGDSQQEHRGDVDSTLTPLGKKQLYDLGVWLRQVYNANEFLGTYDPQHVRLESSGLDRTVTSANALAVGLFPYETLLEEDNSSLLLSTGGLVVPERVSIPVYSFPDEESSSSSSNDVYFRTYHGMCPKYTQNLQTLYQSPQWKTIEANHQALLQKIGALFPDLQHSNGEDAVLDDDGSLVLKHLWTYYDKIHVARTECIPDATAPSCLDLGPDIYQLVDKLTSMEFDQVEFLMGTTERMKYGPGTAGSLLGSPLLWRILERIINASNVSNPPRFFLYSAHAPTILGLISALQETNLPTESHPDYGSALILEVYRDSVTTVQSIRFVYKAASDTMATYFSVREAKCDMEFSGNAAPPATSGGEDSIQHCNLSEFLDWAEANTFRSLSKWCQACQNVQADVCMRDALDNNIAQTLVNELKAALRNDEEADQDAAIIAGTFFGGFLLGLLLMGGVGYCCRRRQRGGMEKNDTKPEATSAVTEIEVPPPVAVNGEMN